MLFSSTSYRVAYDCAAQTTLTVRLSRLTTFTVAVGRGGVGGMFETVTATWLLQFVHADALQPWTR